MGVSVTEEILEGGKHWSMRINRGMCLQLSDLEGAGCVGMIAFNAMDPLERLNIPDSLKCQHTFKLTKGNCLYSDMGRILFSIIEDSHGWHDAVCGSTSQESTVQKWGVSTYQDHRNDFIRSGRESFLVELAKYGLGPRDLLGNINWFCKVEADDSGNLVLDQTPIPGATVTLRFEMDSIVGLHTCPHPFFDALDYPRRPISLQIFDAPERSANDICENFCEENKRGFRNTDSYNRLSLGSSS